MSVYRSIRLCCIFNAPAHYCKAIYSLIDKEYGCKFVFGDDAPTVKRFDTRVLNDCSFLHYRYFKRLLFVPGMLRYAFGPYNNYIINPSTNNVSMWLFLFLIRLMPSKKVFTWTHGMYGNESKRQLFFKRLQHKMCDGEFVYGDYAIKLMKEKGFNPNKLYPIHNSLNYETQLELREHNLNSLVYLEHFRNENPVIIMIGRLNKRKKLSMLLEAAELLKKRGVGINIVFVGDGEEREVLVNIIEDKELSSQVWMYGECYIEEENAKLIYNADLCVMPGDIGLTAIHSLMFGLPVITHNSFANHGPEFEVIKPGKTGDFYKSDDVGSLSDSIEQWFKNKQDREVIRQDCYSVIDKEWTPYYQMNIIKMALEK